MMPLEFMNFFIQQWNQLRPSKWRTRMIMAVPVDDADGKRHVYETRFADEAKDPEGGNFNMSKHIYS